MIGAVFEAKIEIPANTDCMAKIYGRTAGTFLIAVIAFTALLPNVLLAQVTAPFPSTPYPIKPHTWPYPTSKYPPVQYLPGGQSCLDYNSNTTGVGGAEAMDAEADPNTFELDGPDSSTGELEIIDVSLLVLTSPCVEQRRFKPKAFSGKARVQLSNRRPIFSIQSVDTMTLGTTFGIRRLEVSNDSREYPKDLTSVAIKAWHPQWCQSRVGPRQLCPSALLDLQPEQPLEPGEYIIWESTSYSTRYGNRPAHQIWEFAIR